MLSILAGSVTAAQPGASPQPRLVRAAHEFEAQMMKELLKPMSDSEGLPGDEADSGLGATGALGEFASEALGRALSEHGGLGIADRIVLSLSTAGNRPHVSKASGNALEDDRAESLNK
jgi:Rod binding domain-containing protein